MRRVPYPLLIIAATTTLIKGLMRLKKQYGRYATVAIPRDVDCAIAHVFHGISTDVTVLESSIVRDSSRDSSPLLRYASRNMSDVMRMEMY